MNEYTPRAGYQDHFLFNVEFLIFTLNCIQVAKLKHLGCVNQAVASFNSRGASVKKKKKKKAR